jgi:hypothetical protein
MYGLFHDPMLEHAPLTNSTFKDFVDTDDGYVAFKTSDGHFVSQEPNVPGKFGLATAIGPYEKFGGGAGPGIKSSWTRPSQGDKVLNYFCCQLPNA